MAASSQPLSSTSIAFFSSYSLTKLANDSRCAVGDVRPSSRQSGAASANPSGVDATAVVEVVEKGPRQRHVAIVDDRVPLLAVGTRPKRTKAMRVKIAKSWMTSPTFAWGDFSIGTPLIGT